ncbi:MAG: hypothetical protein NTW50_01580 [Candidatus Berkelbacteria bacterium]|nr:hypothetical protein [Candidatus Berkelbacteria bacterium]
MTTGLDAAKAYKAENLSPKKRDFLFHLLKWILILAITIVTIELMTKPFRAAWSKNYTAAGDQLLIQKKYLSASLEYEKALFLNKDNATSKNHLALAQAAQKNVMALKDFFQNQKISIETTSVTAANQKFTDAIAATKEAKSLIEKEEYQMAIVPATNATVLDPKNRDCWLYLGIANLRVAQNVELSRENVNKYLDNAKTAFNTAKTLDPNYQPTQDFLKELAEASSKK